ncbi:MAG: MFS transporter [Treponema sp.]|jgi:PPP family 3-phenylpropionic acid transporter|nr:MFS transporter [Treponema sp.]
MRFIPVFITVFMIFATVSPYISLLVRGLGYRPALVGVLLGVFEGAGIAGPFFFGYFADRTGRYRLCLIVTFVLSVIAVVPLVAFVHPLASALCLALLAFGFRSTIPLLDAFTTVSLKGSGDYGRIRTLGSFSFLVLTIFLQFTPVLRPNRPFNIALWIGFCSALAVFSALPLPGKLINRNFCGTKWRKNLQVQQAPGMRPALRPDSAGSKKRPLWSPPLVAGMIMIILIRLAMTPHYSFFPLYLVEYLQWDAVGLMFAMSSFSELPFMFLSGSLIRRFGPGKLLAVSAVGIGIRLSLYAFVPFRPVVLAAQALHALCFGLFHPAAVALIADCVPPERRALGMSLYLSLGTGFPAFLGNILGGLVLEQWGYRVLFSSFVIFPLLAVVFFFISPQGARKA